MSVFVRILTGFSAHQCAMLPPSVQRDEAPSASASPRPAGRGGVPHEGGGLPGVRNPFLPHTISPGLQAGICAPHRLTSSTPPLDFRPICPPIAPLPPPNRKENARMSLISPGPIPPRPPILPASAQTQSGNRNGREAPSNRLSPAENHRSITQKRKKAEMRCKCRLHRHASRTNRLRAARAPTSYPRSSAPSFSRNAAITDACACSISDSVSVRSGD